MKPPILSAVPPTATAMPADCRAAAAMLNRSCACLSLDHAALRRALEAGGEPLYAHILETRPHLFSDSMVFVGEAHLARMAEIVHAIERVVAHPAWRERVLAWAPAIAGHAPAAAGVFLGYDFHLDADGPRLIEINTNAGGALLNAKLAQAQRTCCGPVAAMFPAPAQVRLEERFVDMFRAEWRRERGEAELGRVAIVDAAPEEQYLAPEFELFRQLFEAHGIDAVVADPARLAFDGARLRCDGLPVDLVYNRLTDFALDEPAHAALRDAYLAGAAVLTPHPHAHALYADKRNLVALCDDDWLAEIGIDADDRRLLLAGVPRTREVLPAAADEFWASRKRWFFKPAAGYGGKAAYRGDKLTKRVFEEIRAGGYIAQEVVPPSERRLQVDAEPQDLKLDLRNYVYDGAVQLVAARLYQGQTTNFRTRGGGFAPVYAVPCQGEEKICR